MISLPRRADTSTCNNTPRIDKSAIRESVSPLEYLRANGVRLRRIGNSLRGPCPLCGGSSRATKFTVSPERGVWKCHGCGEGGDVIRLAELFQRCSFPEALAELAAFGGINTEAEIDRNALDARRREREEQQQREAARRQRERERAESAAQGVWQRLCRQNAAGQAYLRSRAIADHAAAECRYGKHHVCLPLFQPDGRITNVVGRRIDGGQPKIRGLACCRTRATFGSPAQIERTDGPIVVCEGLMDYLSARTLWPDRAAFGAHGATNLPHVVEELARIAGDRMFLLLPHNDEAGARATQSAIESAAKAGALARISGIPQPYNDLNDYLRCRAANARRGARGEQQHG